MPHVHVHSAHSEMAEHRIIRVKFICGLNDVDLEKNTFDNTKTGKSAREKKNKNNLFYMAAKVSERISKSKPKKQLTHSYTKS